MSVFDGVLSTPEMLTVFSERSVVDADLARAIKALLALSERHASTPMLARTSVDRLRKAPPPGCAAHGVDPAR